MFLYQSKSISTKHKTCTTIKYLISKLDQEKFLSCKIWVQKVPNSRGGNVRNWLCHIQYNT